MTQTLVRPSAIKAKKIKPSDMIGDPGTPVLRRRRTPGSLNSHQQFQLDRLIRSSACFCPSPFVLKRRDSTRYALTDNQRLEMYRLVLEGFTYVRVADITGTTKALVATNTGYVMANFEAVVR
jgi:hypothetical protein